MNIRSTLSILLISCLFYTNPILGKEAMLDISITGYANNSSTEAVLKFYTDPEVAPYSKTISNEKRNRYGHFVDELEPGFDLEKIKQLFIIGRIRNNNGDNVAYIPLTILNKSHFNVRGYAKLSIPCEININKAFEESYPFSEGFHEGFINEDNLKPVLVSTRLLIEKGFVIGDKWGDVFNSFLQNIHFFKCHNPDISRILKYLRTYGNLANNDEYYTFYAKALVRLDKLGVDGTEVAPNESLGKYVQKEWETLLIDHPLSVIPVVRIMIDTLVEEKRYSECVDLGGLAFKQFQTQEVIDEILKDRQTLSYVNSVMQGVTECFQLDFLIRSPDGSRSDVKKATEFLRTDNETNIEVNCFIDLYEALERHGLFPRRPGRWASASDASRIEQISKYYWWFTEK